MIVAVDVGEKRRPVAARGDEGEGAGVGMAVGDDASAIGAGGEGEGGGGNGNEAIGPVGDAAYDGDGIDTAKIVTALIPGGEIEDELTAGEDGADLGIGATEGEKGGCEAGAEVGRAEKDGFADFVVWRGREEAGRRGPFSGEMSAENKAAHGVGNHIDLGVIDGPQLCHKELAQILDRRTGGAGWGVDNTVIEKHDFAAEIAETLGKLAKGAFGGDGAAGRELEAVNEDDGLGKGGKGEQ